MEDTTSRIDLTEFSEKIRELKSCIAETIVGQDIAVDLILTTILANGHEESRKLRRDLIGELKDAAIKLYQRQDYSNSLLFCNDFLESKPDDKDVLFTKARCLSRIGKISESKNILENLIKHGQKMTDIAYW